VSAETKQKICALPQNDSLGNRFAWQEVRNSSTDWMNAYHNNPSQYPSAFTLAYPEETSEKLWADFKIMRGHAGCFF
jgi:hypothetical protein